MLSDKSMTELRVLAQAHDVKDFLSKTKPELVQAIQIKITDMQPTPKVEVPKPEYDPRLMTAIPARKSEQATIEALLKPYIDRGLKLSFPEPEVWAMSCGKRNDTGSMRVPPRVVLKCADRVLNGK